MSRFRVLVVFGTRPEAIKLAPVIRELKKRSDVFDVKVCVTAQHREMLDQVLEIFKISPDIDLDLMQPNQSLSDLSASIFTHLDPVVKEFDPDWLLAQGDTTTVVVASLVAYYQKVQFGHVEAGLRTGNKWQPFPEEINRRVAGVVADLHFAPTDWARRNLLKEGVPEEKIVVTGNPVIDALHWVALQPYRLEALIEMGMPKEAVNGNKKLILVTAHRRENFGAPLEGICSGIRILAERYEDQVHFIYPVHMNPNVWRVVHKFLGNIPNVTLLPPVDYSTLVQILRRSFLVLTDSGGLQEEAPGFGVPVLVLREVTERPEGVTAGTVRLVGTSPRKIVSAVSQLIENSEEYDRMAHAINPYGDGHASERIVDALESTVLR